MEGSRNYKWKFLDYFDLFLNPSSNLRIIIFNKVEDVEFGNLNFSTAQLIFGKSK